jgi:hypothetical protein
MRRWVVSGTEIETGEADEWGPGYSEGQRRLTSIQNPIQMNSNLIQIISNFVQP